MKWTHLWCSCSSSCPHAFCSSAVSEGKFAVIDLKFHLDILDLNFFIQITKFWLKWSRNVYDWKIKGIKVDRDIGENFFHFPRYSTMFFHTSFSAFFFSSVVWFTPIRCCQLTLLFTWRHCAQSLILMKLPSVPLSSTDASVWQVLQTEKIKRKRPAMRHQSVDGLLVGKHGRFCGEAIFTWKSRIGRDFFNEMEKYDKKIEGNLWGKYNEKMWLWKLMGLKKLEKNEKMKKLWIFNFQTLKNGKKCERKGKILPFLGFLVVFAYAEYTRRILIEMNLWFIKLA